MSTFLPKIKQLIKSANYQLNYSPIINNHYYGNSLINSKNFHVTKHIFFSDGVERFK
jgi:hypothetical protein